MRRKRLQHHAHVFCHMFRGWQLLGDYRTLTELGSGTLEIDLLTLACRHNGSAVPTLRIAEAIGAWWRSDLTAHHISLDDITSARLTVQLQIAEQNGPRDLSRVWADPAPIFISCGVGARSAIVTNERAYEAEYTDRLEWPRNWAA